jgi:hypothetical protein
MLLIIAPLEPEIEIHQHFAPVDEIPISDHFNNFTNLVKTKNSKI